MRFYTSSDRPNDQLTSNEFASRSRLVCACVVLGNESEAKKDLEQWRKFIDKMSNENRL